MKLWGGQIVVAGDRWCGGWDGLFGQSVEWWKETTPCEHEGNPIVVGLVSLYAQNLHAWLGTDFFKLFVNQPRRISPQNEESA